MLSRMNDRGLLGMEISLEKLADGRNKWIEVSWQRPRFPLIEDNIRKNDINNYWVGKPVRFAPYNNCVGCFHRSPVFLRYMFDEHPKKMAWFAKQEGGDNGFWREDIPYRKIEKMMSQIELYPSDFSECDSGYCGL